MKNERTILKSDENYRSADNKIAKYQQSPCLISTDRGRKNVTGTGCCIVITVFTQISAAALI